MIPRTVILAACLQVSSAARAAQTCESLAKLDLPATSITSAESVAAGSFTPPGGKAITYLPAFCRVTGAIKPSPDSNIQFEVWMPASNWNGKFQGAGNGGFAGYIGYDQLANAVRHNYTSAATDTGHRATPGVDAGWALDHPEKIADFGYRAIHETAVKAKAILHAFYGEAPKRSYFSSCSNGGRQALMEAQRYPEDYDGIIAGAPANYWTHLLANAAWDDLALLGDKDSFIPPKKLPAIQAAALAACDALDGVKDGVIEDPSRCHFDPGVLLCQAAEQDSCLTAPQVAALKKLYAGGRNSHGQLFPGYAPGGEAESGGWAVWITGAVPERSLMYAFGTQFFKNMVFDNAAWDYHTFNADRDTKAADDKQSGNLNATDPDLGRFRERGGKLILYHGWSDASRRRTPSTITTASRRKWARSRRAPSCACSWCRACNIAAAAPAPIASASLQSPQAMPIATWMPRWSAGSKKASLPSASWPPNARATWTRRAPSCARARCAPIL